MSAPNIVTSSTMYGRTAGMAVSATPTSIVSNATGSNTVVKVNALMVSNVDPTGNYWITVDVYNGSTAYRIAYQITIPANAGMDVLVKSVYLEEGWSIRLSSSFSGKIEAIASYEVVS